MSLKYEPASEPLHISVKSRSIPATHLGIHGAISPHSGRVCVKSLRSSFTGLYPHDDWCVFTRGCIPRRLMGRALRIRTVNLGGGEADARLLSQVVRAGGGWVRRRVPRERHAWVFSQVKTVFVLAGEDPQAETGGQVPPERLRVGRRGIKPLSQKERLVCYCRTTSASTAPRTSRRMCCPTHCASYCAPCQPLLRAFSGWIRSPPPTSALPIGVAPT